jgi:hypothetical protein
MDNSIIISSGPLAEELIVKEGSMEKVLIFSRTINDRSTLRIFLLFGHSLTCPASAHGMSKYRHMEMFHIVH